MPKKKALPQLGPLRIRDLCFAPGYLIRRSHQIAVAIFFKEFEGYEVTPVQYAALIAIRDKPGMDQRTLVTQIAIDRSTIGTMLKILEDRRLIFRLAPKNNRRIKQLFIAEAGEKLLESTRQHTYRVQERILAPLSPKERRIFMELLSRLVHVNNEHSRVPLMTRPPILVQS